MKREERRKREETHISDYMVKNNTPSFPIDVSSSSARVLIFYTRFHCFHSTALMCLSLRSDCATCEANKHEQSCPDCLKVTGSISWFHLLRSENASFTTNCPQTECPPQTACSTVTPLSTRLGVIWPWVLFEVTVFLSAVVVVVLSANTLKCPQSSCCMCYSL